MMPSKNGSIVPSRTALQALRRLAFHGTTVITALGSLCGAAAISYDARQRVKLAEKVIDTKRTIRSVSNGRGAAVIQRRFELAEKGEDFLLGHSVQKRTRRRRNHSSVAVGQADYVNSAPPISPHQQAGQSGSRRPEERIYTWGSSLPAGPSDLLARIVPQSAKDPILNESSSVHSTQTWYDQQLFDFAQITPKPHSRWAPRHAKSSNEIQLEELHADRLRLPLRWRERRKGAQELLWYGAAARDIGRPDVGSAVVDALHRGRYSANPRLSRLAQSNDLAGLSETPFSDPSFQVETPKLTQFTQSWTQDGCSWKDTVVTRPSSSPAPPTGTAVERILKASQMTSKTETDHVYARPSHRRTNALHQVSEPTGEVQGASARLRRLHQQPAVHDGEMLPATAVSISHRPRVVGTWPPQNMNDQALRDAGHKLSLETKQAGESGFEMFPGRRTANIKRLRPLQPVVAQPSRSSQTEDVGTLYAPPPTSVNLRNDEFESVYTSEEAEQQKGPDSGLSPMPSAVHATAPVRKLSLVAHMDTCKFIKRFNRLMHLGAVQSAAETWPVFLNQFFLNTFDSRQILLRTCRYCQSRMQTRIWRHFIFIKLIQKFFALDPDSPDATALLFSSYFSVSPRYKSKRIRDRSTLESGSYHKPPQRYLIGITEYTEDPVTVSRELDNVLRAAQRYGAPIGEDFFFVVLQWYWTSNHAEYAKQLFATMSDTYGVQPTFYTLTVMLRGYALAGDWNRVRTEIEHLHTKGESRKEPVGFSNMFLSVFRVQLTQSSLVQAYDFLLHAITYSGLVPTQAVTTEIIQACIKERRFDLLREWVETVRAMFPQVDTSTNNNMAFHIGTAWRQSNASAEEIEEACKAIAYRSTTNPFTPAFGRIVRECVAEHLASILYSRSDRVGDPIDYLTHAYVIFDKPESARLSLRQYSRTISRLNRLLSSSTIQELRQVQYQDQWYNNVAELMGPRPIVPDQKVTVTLPSALTEDALPSQRTIENLVRHYYTRLRWDEVDNGLVVLEYACQRLTRHGRIAESGIILSAIYLDPPSNFLRFSIELMSAWLLAAYETKSLPTIRLALIASLDVHRGPARITERFLLLAKMCMTKLQSWRFPNTKEQELEELGWLYNRILRRKAHDEVAQREKWSSVPKGQEQRDNKAEPNVEGLEQPSWHTRRHISARETIDWVPDIAGEGSHMTAPRVGVTA